MSSLDAGQRAAWTAALELWGVQLHDPVFTPRAGRDTFAWFSFPPQVFLDPDELHRQGVDDQLGSVFAHEIGHHVLSPSTRVTSLKIIQQQARAITVTLGEPPADLTERSQLLANLWSDMLINVRVARRQHQLEPTSEPEMITLWRRLSVTPPTARSWWVVLRAYELLWSLPDGSLCPTEPPALVDPKPGDQPPDPRLDAQLLAETVRTFAEDPVAGALRFGMIMAGYLVAPDRNEGCGGELDGRAPTAAELAEVLRDGRLQEEPEHPAVAAARRRGGGAAPAAGTGRGAGLGQGYGLADTLRLWSAADPATVTRAWYEAAARPWRRAIRERVPDPGPAGELPGATELWELDDELDRIDWPATLVAGPRPIPGVTTRQRPPMADEPPRRLESIDLDLYVDSSGSMPSPERESPVVLAGAIVIGSVLRVGGLVRVTSFSGSGEVAGTTDFTRRADEAMSAVLHYFGGGTTFPLDLLALRYLRPERTTPGRPVRRRHLLVLSDDGLASMFGSGQPTYADVAVRVAERLDTGTLMLLDPQHSVAEVAATAGYGVLYLDEMADAPKACAAFATKIEAERG